MPEPGGAPLILASASPRRRELLAHTGLPFEVIPSAYEEPSPETHPDPAAFARGLSREKALDVARRHPGRVVIGADTIVVLGERLYNKPTGPADAVRMLLELSGRTHEVITGVTLVDGRDGELESVSFESRTQVTFRSLQRAEVEAYVASGEPLDKAGAYGIQRLGVLLIERIEGDYFSVVGLPLTPLALQLRRLGFPVLGVT